MYPRIATHILTIIVILCYFLNVFWNAVINFWGIKGKIFNIQALGDDYDIDDYDYSKHDWICSVTQSIGVIFLHTAKVAIYCIFILRVETSFKGSVYEYSPKFIGCLFFSLFIVYMVDIFGDIFATNGYWIYNKEYDIYWCQLNAATWGLGFTVLVDLFFSIVCLVLFTKPIKHLMKQINSKELQMLNTKYSILTMTAVSSTCMFVCLLFVCG